MGIQDIKRIKQEALEPKKKKFYKIPRFSKKRLEKIETDKEILEADKLFYLKLWNERPHVCECGCNARLGNIINFFFFHHLLEKENYPEFRHAEINIMFLATDCHYSYHSLSDTRPEVKRRREEVEKILIP